MTRQHTHFSQLQNSGFLLHSFTQHGDNPFRLTASFCMILCSVHLNGHNRRFIHLIEQSDVNCVSGLEACGNWQTWQLCSKKAVPISPAAAIFINCISHGIKGVFFANLSSFFAWKNGGENSILYIGVKILPLEVAVQYVAL